METVLTDEAAWGGRMGMKNIVKIPDRITDADVRS
jgi:hypothetical protein